MWKYVEHYWEDYKDVITIILEFEGKKKTMSFTRETYEMLGFTEEDFVKRTIDKLTEEKTNV